MDKDIYFQFTVQRIHWLRARAQRYRWEEESILVQYEMQWTVRYFINEARKWNKYQLLSEVSPGARAYAARQAAISARRAATSEREFKIANPNHVTLLT